MSGKIFINYRRSDDPASAGRLFDRLEEEFGFEELFLDVEGHMKGGYNYVDFLQQKVDECDIMITVIGPRWLSASDETGRSRLQNPNDWVRIEITSALEKKKWIIPMLMGDTGMPRDGDVPEDLSPLLSLHAIRVSHERFKSDCQGLISQIKSAFREIEQAREAETLAEKQAAEEAARKRREEQEAREAEAKERERQQLLEGLSPDDIRKAEELNNWEFVKKRLSVEDLRDHIARFPDGTTLRYAQTELETLVWAGLGTQPSIADLGNFLDEFKHGDHAPEARQRLKALEDEEKKRIDEQIAAEKAKAEQVRINKGTTNVGSLKRIEDCKPGNGREDWFKDKPFSPEMVIIPPGSFMMGSAEGEGKDNERPRHKVKIDYPFAVSRFAVTFDEWDYYTSQKWFPDKPSDEGWGRGNLPVINISWNDAQSYVKWLSKATGQRYRLFSEAEWEYACRAGTDTQYWWGNEFTDKQANYSRGGGKTVPVDSFAPNPWGLYNVHGNVWEWCEDLWHDNYTNAPADGSAWQDGGLISARVLRGGSWSNDPQILRARDRYGINRDLRINRFGLRVARMP